MGKAHEVVLDVARRVLHTIGKYQIRRHGRRADDGWDRHRPCQDERRRRHQHVGSVGTIQQCGLGAR
jgi:hypothetical protein